MDEIVVQDKWTYYIYLGSNAVKLECVRMEMFKLHILI